MMNPRDLMADTPSPGARVKAEEIEVFNHAVTRDAKYVAKQKVKTSATVFFDCKDSSTLPCEESQEGWCTITEDLANWLTTSTGSSQLIRLQNSAERKDLRHHPEHKPSKTDAASSLKIAMGQYLQQHK
jgi:hypothetical protein